MCPKNDPIFLKVGKSVHKADIIQSTNFQPFLSNIPSSTLIYL